MSGHFSSGHFCFSFFELWKSEHLLAVQWPPPWCDTYPCHRVDTAMLSDALTTSGNLVVTTMACIIALSHFPFHRLISSALQCRLKPTPSVRVPDNFTVDRLVKKFAAPYGISQRFPSWARWIHSAIPYPVFLRPILILTSYIRLGIPSGFFP